MNQIIKGILIVAAITSMLVVGATTMFPIMQNASARSTNTNSNTNSADSSSTSNATADNTNNITNSATASNSQEQSACAVAVTCPGGTTTVTPSPIAGCPSGTLFWRARTMSAW
jgi:cytoskeletal protein RodZ